jgi:hypothetical protein
MNFNRIISLLSYILSLDSFICLPLCFVFVIWVISSFVYRSLDFLSIFDEFLYIFTISFIRIYTFTPFLHLPTMSSYLPFTALSIALAENPEVTILPIVQPPYLQYPPFPAAHQESILTDLLEDSLCRTFIPLETQFNVLTWKQHMYAELAAVRQQRMNEDQSALLRQYYRIGQLLHYGETNLLNGEPNTRRRSNINRRKLQARFRQAIGGLTTNYIYHFKVARRTHAIFRVRGWEQLRYIKYSTPSTISRLSQSQLRDAFTMAWQFGTYQGSYDYSFDL